MNAEKIISGDSPERNGKCQSASRNKDACERKNKTSIRTYTHTKYMTKSNFLNPNDGFIFSY